MALVNQTPITVDNTIQKVLASANRSSIIFQNRGAAEIFLGGSNLTTSNGIGIGAGDTLIITQGDGDSTVDEAWFATMPSGTAELRIVTA